MSENKLNITSTAVEKGIDLAKEFLDKLLAPAVQETGLLISDQVSKFRFNNQLRILTKAREKCIKHGINPKTISFKILCPFLEGASLEEDEEMTNVWSSLLSNLVDSQQNIENHIFPYLLSQISKQEWTAIKDSYLTFQQIQVELESLAELEQQSNLLNSQTQIAIEKLTKEKESGIIDQKELEEKSKILIDKKKQLENEKDTLKNKKYIEPELNHQLISEDYQYSNLYRLGLIKKKPNYYTYIEQPRNGLNSEIENRVSYYNDDAYEYQNIKLNIDELKVHIEEDGEEYFLTDLGMIFVKSCLDKDQQ